MKNYTTHPAPRIALLVFLVAGALSATAYAEGPPTSNGVISNPTLVANQDIAKAQAVGVITTFMTQGSQTCDADGKNCRSLFGADDNLDYGTLQQNTQSMTGVQSFSFMGGGGDDRDANSVSAQTGTLALACGDTAVKMVAGIAVKATSCRVADNGDATLTVQMCSAPSRGNPIKQPDNAVLCSDDPTSPSFRPPQGKVCMRPACDSEPVGSLDGWSSPLTLSYKASLPTGATEDTKAKNGLGLSFYPPLTGGVTPSYKADSDNMTAVKVVQTFVNTSTKRTAVGLKIAYRHKAVVTKDMMTKGPSSVPNPRDHTAQWDTVTKLQGNALIPKYQEQFGKNGSECLQQINSGMAKDGVISVCDKNYTNESGIKPIATTAVVAADGQNCGTTPQCLNEVVNTNTWTETCRSDVPLAMRSCSTVTDFTKNVISFTRTRTQEICHEKRLQAQYSCQTKATVGICERTSVIGQGGVNLTEASGDTNIVFVGMSDPDTALFRLGTVGDNYWGDGYYSRTYNIDILDKSYVYTFRMYAVGFDDEMAVAVNDNWLWSDYGGGTFDAQRNNWGRWATRCSGSKDNRECNTVWETQWERSTSWGYGVNVDFKPYLREGRNYIRVDTGVVGGGEGWIYLQISAWKPTCTIDVVNECSGYEAAR